MRNAGIQVISRAGAVLRVCGASQAGLSLGDIATVLALPRSTVQRIVNALVTERLLQADGTRHSIRIGPGLHAISNAQRIDVIEIVHPFLKELSAITGETVDLAEFKRDHLVFVDQVSGSQRLRAISSVGEVFPLHNTANGKAALSLLPDHTVIAVLHSNGQIQGATLTRFMDEIETVRRTGIAEDTDQHVDGISAVGTAFRTAIGDIYALSIPLPSVRFPSRKIQLSDLLLTFCRRIEVALKSSR
jgi:DNA-binding IclR family transcriptional regulator